ncbi:MAG: suppressor of fused domain protein, partial [Pseudomonadota bacterium]
RFALPSGSVELLSFVGMTDSELDFAKANGNDALIARLRSSGFFPVINPQRQSVV